MTVQPSSGAVHALITPANAPERAVVDAIDQALLALAPYRAVAALANVEQLASEQDLPRLTRSELTALLEVLTDNMAQQMAKAREVAHARAAAQTGLSETTH